MQEEEEAFTKFQNTDQCHTESKNFIRLICVNDDITQKVIIKNNFLSFVIAHKIDLREQ